MKYFTDHELRLPVGAQGITNYIKSMDEALGGHARRAHETKQRIDPLNAEQSDEE
ncbi:hypothetical protein D3C87_2011310 [compost metagenome]